MAAFPRGQKVTSTTSAQPLGNYNTAVPYNHLLVMNKTDGDVEVYVQNTNVNIILPANTGAVLDEFTFQGQLYYLNTTGTGGDLYLATWFSEAH